ncbi:hypothetical protein [Pseudogracilibacillus auburnensis]|uniref:hypothetical protein n=1 Tax=Pseudogracilibacillus auburnensis TaxID=1494959 RepID=UPI001A9657F4|nr:hypothetical protein [Pseudogracilibacillus auburnensis]MBO1003147.1 hypothetical protein [Pseudogracilibacillus auburnensis]
MTQIYREHLDFMEEAKNAFEANERLETCTNADGTLIALRYGVDRDCIQIHELGEQIGFFANIMRKAPKLYVGDFDES